MSEALALVCKLAFETLGVNRIEIPINASNHRSTAVPRRAGFVLEGTHRQSSRRQTGELDDVMVFSMLREDYFSKLAASTR